jgi:choline dehydrogenase-like flavoprotein
LLNVFFQIVVGGGTAGLAVATRVSQYLSNCSVLVIEAGPDGRNVPGIYVAGMKGSTLGSTYDWNFTTVPQPYANNRILPQNRGKVLGGSSALNLLSYDRGVEADFDAWQELGNDGWDWDSMHAAMENAETYQVTSVNGSVGIAEAGGVGYEGPIHSLVNRFSPPQQELFFPTMQNLGLRQTYEFLNGDMIGWMRHTSGILNTNYTRSYSPVYLNGAGSNLNLMLSTMVAKVNLDNSNRATGVTLQDGTIINANNEV